MRMSVDASDAIQKAKDLNHALEIMPKGIELAIEEGMKPMYREIKTYPAIPSPRNPKYAYRRGKGTEYLPTHKIQYTSEIYGKQTFKTGAYRNAIFGEIDQPASYADYVRGNLTDRPQPAWMHKGVWKSLREIVDTHLPRIFAILDKRVQEILDRLW